MLDVHPAHHAASTWRDFFIHIVTIVIGLLIAIGLEQTVEHIQCEVTGIKSPAEVGNGEVGLRRYLRRVIRRSPTPRTLPAARTNNLTLHGGMPTAFSGVPAAARTSSFVAARISLPARWKMCSTPIPPSMRPAW